MTDKPKLLDPPPAAIEVGYYLMKARMYCSQPVIPRKDGTFGSVTGYLMEASQSVVEAAPAVSAQSGMLYMQPETGQRLIMEALAGIHKIGEAHDYFRKMMAELGYRPITKQDFAQFGDGGDR